MAEHADVWVTASLLPDQLDEQVRLSGVLDRHCEAIGRDPGTIRRAVQFRVPDTADGTLRAAERYVQAGFTDIVLMPLSHGALTGLAGLLPALRSLG